MKLSELIKGTEAVIAAVNDPDLERCLIEMGIFAGQSVSIFQIAPFGCPLLIKTGNTRMSIRRAQADLISVE